MNRTKLLRSLVNLTGGNSETIHIRGPNNTFGKAGEVSYVACYTDLDAYSKQLICDTIKRMDPQIERAYVTKRTRVPWSRNPVYHGGNIKVVYHTRANGKPA